MTKQTLQKFWHELFEFGVIIKALDGLWQTASGLLFLFVSKSTINAWLFWATRDELADDPHDRLANWLMHTFQNFPDETRIFAAAYIIIHGLVNLFIAVQLYREKHWAFLAAIGAMLIFMAYQIYRISLYHSPVLVALTIFDALFIVVAWHEYKYHKNKTAKKLEAETI